MGRKSNEQIIKEQGVTIRDLSKAYTFLLCATVIFLYSIRSLTFSYRDVTISSMSILLPVVYFVSCITTKDLGYKYGAMSVIISTITLFFYGAFVNFFTTGNFQVGSICVITLAYFTTQSICLSTYNYFLVNTRLPIFVVIGNYMFSSLVFNMIYMLFNYKMVVTDTFWLEYLLLVMLQLFLAIVLAIFDCLVERGIDN